MLGIKSQTTPYTVLAGGEIYTIWLVTLDANAQPVANQPVTVRSAPAGCGSFGGSPQVQVMSSSIGDFFVPTWTAADVTGSCVIIAELSGNPNASISIDVHVVGGSAPVPTPTPTGPPAPLPGDPPPNILPTRTVAGLSPGGVVALSLASASSSCSLTRSQFVDPQTVLSPRVPDGMAAPYGWIEFSTTNCATGQATGFAVDFPQPLPSTAQWWRYGATPDDRTRHWYPVASIVNGNRLTFSIEDGGYGDDDARQDGGVAGLGMLAVPGGVTQDLWWGGAAENGWGMSILQHRDVLFANIFVYDAQGKPVWYVMPSGAWNAAHTAYTGALYLPKGSPFFAYDASRFDVGPSVGTATLTFASPNEASFEYTINGVPARKNITRIPFGPRDAPADKSMADLWWAGVAQNGWGIAILQQYATLFALWYTYDASGNATWFVMPGVQFVARDTYSGSIYRPEGAPWLGVSYDASRHRTVEAGSFHLRFSGEAATFDYTLDGKTGSIPLTRIPF